MSPAWRLAERAPLRARNTFGVQAHADLLLEVRDAVALPELFTNAALRDGPVLVLGGGNPGLKPENSESWNAGVIWEPSFARLSSPR